MVRFFQQRPRAYAPICPAPALSRFQSQWMEAFANACSAASAGACARGLPLYQGMETMRPRKPGPSGRCWKIAPSMGVITPASFDGRLGQTNRSFVDPEMTARPAATERSSNDRQHIRVGCVAPRADVSAGDVERRPSFHAVAKCKALAKYVSPLLCQVGRFSAGTRVSTRSRRNDGQSSRPRNTAACPKCGATIEVG